MYEAIGQRIKSTDFQLKCRAMYYFSKGRHDHQERKMDLARLERLKAKGKI